jgi:MoaA/NifB/PqqE/SkfB family radical SAM enzyme
MNIQPVLEDYFRAVSYLRKSTRKKCMRIPRIIRSFRSQYYDLISRTLREKKQAIPCYAGFSSAYINPDGRVWICGVKGGDVGSLRDFNYDFCKIWFNEECNKARQEIKNTQCFCSATCPNYVNMLCNANTLAGLGFTFLRSSFW